MIKVKKIKVNKIPNFRSEDEESKFWETHSVLDFPDTFKQVKLDLSKLKPSTKVITMRLPDGLLQDLKILANKKDVPYQSLVKIILADKINSELYS